VTGGNAAGGGAGGIAAGCTDLESRAAYLGGLVKGLDLASNSEQGRVLQLIVDLLADTVREVTRLGAPDRDAATDAASETSPTPDAGDTLDMGAPGQAADVPVFFACECPRCGEDIFIEAEAFRNPSPTGSQGVRLLEAPSLLERRSAGEPPGPPNGPAGPGEPVFLPREFEVTCSNCGEAFLVREKGPAPNRPGGRRRGPDPLSPRRPDRRPRRPTQH